MEKTYPLIIVFYLDGEMMKQKEIITPFVEAVNNMLHQKNANALAFFLPTAGEERIECVSPVIVKEADMDKINTIIEDIKTNFSVAAEMELPIEEDTTDVEIKEEHND
jgi:hypothetical protein